MIDRQLAAGMAFSGSDHAALIDAFFEARTGTDPLTSGECGDGLGGFSLAELTQFVAAMPQSEFDRCLAIG